MMIPMETYLRRGQQSLRRILSQPKTRLILRATGYALASFLFSAAGLLHGALPLAMAFVLACSGWSAVLAGAGGCLGYLVFWGAAGYQGILWSALALITALLLGDRRLTRDVPFLIPALAGLLISGSGVFFQAWLADDTSVGLYLLRVGLGVGSSWLFTKVLQGRNPILDWLACGLAVLSLAQIAPILPLNLGIIAGSALSVLGAFPAAAMAGLALDLSGISPVSMTAILCGAYLIRFLPHYPRWIGMLAPAAAGVFLLSVTGTYCPALLPGLLLGGAVGTVLPLPPKIPSRRGETGVAQVRLEMAANALSQSGQLLLEVPEVPVDEDSLVRRAAELSCSTCPCRRGCKDSPRIADLPGLLLHKPLLSSQELPVICRKSSRFLAQLHRFQEQLRSIQADRLRQQEYRDALVQQYRFLSRYLQTLSDQLTCKAERNRPVFSPSVEIYANRPEEENGDRVMRFAGVGCRYYVLLCDGMGTGLGAIQEAGIALQLLRRLLSAGFPPEHALQSLNSLCALRSRAGAVTIDMAELQLDTGRVQLYKWGAMPSFLICGTGAKKIGTAGPPPGLSVADGPGTTYQLSLRRGETLVLVSDGVFEEDALHCCLNMAGSSPGELAKSLLTCSQYTGEDDATVVLVHLDPGLAAT